MRFGKAKLKGYEQLHWTQFKRVPAGLLSRQQRAWVLGSGSLTRQLVKASKGSFSVEVTSQGYGFPCHHERRCLKLRPRQVALLREVNLWVQGQPWVVARTVIPVSTLKGKERRLAHLGTKPLGEYVFKQKNMRREPIELACDWRTLGSSSGIGRRSIFKLNQKPVLVSEFFQPICLQQSPP